MPSASGWDVLVVGAGHAGVEAASASARMGASTLLVSMDLDAVARMSCNPAVGGLAKGQIVREVDALGGMIGLLADRTAIQFRLLNRSKGPAVRAPRAQCDRRLYSVAAKAALETVPNLTLCQGTVTEILTRGDRVTGVACEGGERYQARAVVLCPGTFMSAVLHTGEKTVPGGRIGEPAADAVSKSLAQLAFPVGRLKTGTPPRLDSRSIDYEALERQDGDEEPVFFSFLTESADLPQVPCYVTFTNEKTHAIIAANLDRAPVYTGQISSTGPRYCPSIEVKVVRFPDRIRHQVFIEPEGLETDEVYVNGVSTSLPRDVQEEMIHSIRGLERARIVRYGYAVEYDYVEPQEVCATLETKRVERLFFAGQINGTSGYEEAAGQGLLAGINAALSASGGEQVTLGRHEAYIGVMIDDLVTKGVDEPYRMFTSRAEYRLLLRYDNADFRLTPLARRLGLADASRVEHFERRRREVDQIRRFLATTRRDGATLEEIVRRPGGSIAEIANDYGELSRCGRDALELVANDVRYAGYIARQHRAAARMAASEAQRIPARIDYDAMGELRFESREKLKMHLPETIGQATRIPGVNPADISILLMYLKRGAPTKHSVE